MSKTNYNKAYKKPETVTETTVIGDTIAENVIEADDVPTSVVEEQVEASEPKHGKVVDCILLNIRKAPSTSAKILGTLSVGDEVVIHEEVGEFYKIGNPDGNEYCMKKFISVK